MKIRIETELDFFYNVQHPTNPNFVIKSEDVGEM